MNRALALVVLLAACGDNLAPPPRADCSAYAPPPTGLGLDAAREAHRRAALRQHLRYREALEPGYVMRETRLVADQARIDRGEVCAQELYEVGRILFEHDFTFADGLATSDAAPFHRVQRGRAGGPETTSCTSCHWRSGPGGAGAFPDNAYLLGDGDRISSADARNPPSLIGAGVVQALADEMTAELAQLRADAIARGRATEVELVTKGISFGTLHVDARGNVSTDDVRGIDRDLVVRPFGWKGTARTITELVTEAAAAHLGVQSEDAALVEDPLELGGGPPEDPDGDGIANELTSGQATALAVYVASLELPINAPFESPDDLAHPAGPTQPYLVDEWARGRVILEQIGCTGCHTPSLPLARTVVAITSPLTAGSVMVDLANGTEAPRVARDAATGTYNAFVYSDFKRHDLGGENASQHVHGGIATRFYLTRRLWGVGETAPYFHDGASVTLDDAIGRHHGEAEASRLAWTQLPREDRDALRVFLTSLRRAPRLVVP